MTSTAPALADEHFLLLDGWQHRRQPGHWQGWLAERLVERGASVDYLTLPDPEHPRYADWSDVALRALRGRERVTVVAHGLSVLLWLRMCGDRARDAALADGRPPAPLARRAVLVAPPATGMHGGDVSESLPVTVTAEAVAAATVEPALLLSSIGDPYLPEGAETRYGLPLGLATVEVPGGGHLNQAAGFGPWPEMLQWCETGVWPLPAVASGDEELGRALAAHFSPQGRRLGIAVLGPISDAGTEAVEEALRAAGLEPERRLARLFPRVGEESLRVEDVAEFAELYGHEYSVAVVDAGAFAEQGDRRRIESAYRGAGCTVVWSESVRAAV
ncbi:RBBP9/YdeN family alpha/beta hydrolase [Herbiconiux ginsengi]|uniref:Predicted esterase of the alpha/beta hydrolase fold n=1 Tax=Herbiconiux ginsengi TaxID=381665 RepID=A0A1H3KX33_9MICO|nr:alpha/beta hydrolase [Herbiconiux ginsengi]SDY56586.1 Predicted esterase of the alpha/beta hydrolase fold [Herbiconiux ginsengi]